MSRKTIEQLIDAYGNASFECGEWSEGDEDTYETVHARAQSARNVLLNALRKAGLPTQAMVTV